MKSSGVYDEFAAAEIQVQHSPLVHHVKILAKYGQWLVTKSKWSQEKNNLSYDYKQDGEEYSSMCAKEEIVSFVGLHLYDRLLKGWHPAEASATFASTTFIEPIQ